ncbi:MAG: glycoside hydrolase family 26 protein [Mediterranea sp.]|jgi:mannan endo-1,4-beta-mannosidase|nr:glycoside hydrolase family 26 protein [Mediterranea sp.]
MKTIHSILAAALAACCASCSDSYDNPAAIQPEPIPEGTTLSLIDADATAETRALYANLWEVQQTGFMFGHHDDLWYGRKWYNEEGGSDTKAVCGDYPAVFSFDVGPIMDDRFQSEENTMRRRVAIEAYDRGEVLLACAHLNNPLTGGDSWDNSSNEVARQILTDGSPTNVKFKGWLDRLADFALNLRGADGSLVPIIMRPFHEHTQTWSWWGSQCTTQEEFVALWKFTIDYLRHTKGVHQFIYAISPQMDVPKTMDDFLFRWPGDDYVDFIGMDSYHGLNATTLSVNLRTLSQLSQAKRKPCGVTENGVEGFTAANYWSEQVLTPATGRKVSMIVMWRNKYVAGNDADQHYFSVFPGHPSEADFVRFYNSSVTLFSADLPDMYH